MYLRPLPVSASAFLKLASSNVTPVSSAVRASRSKSFARVSSFARAFLSPPSPSTFAKSPAASVAASTLPKSRTAPFLSATRQSSETSTAPSAQFPGFARMPSPRPLTLSAFVTPPLSSVLSSIRAVMPRKRLHPRTSPSTLARRHPAMSFSAAGAASTAISALARSASASSAALTSTPPFGKLLASSEFKGGAPLPNFLGVSFAALEERPSCP